MEIFQTTNALVHGVTKKYLLLVPYTRISSRKSHHDVFDPPRTLHEESYCMVELVRQVGSVGRETRELQETVRYLESRYTRIH